MVENISWFLSESGVILGYCTEDDKRYDRTEASFDLNHDALRLPVPFKPGDIVTVDMRPAMDVIHAVITWRASYNDCCSPGCLFINKKGYVDVSALKHLHFSYRFPDFSPLLRLSLFIGELPEHEVPFKTVSERLKEGSINGEDFYMRYDNEVKYSKKYHRYLWEDFKAYFNL